MKSPTERIVAFYSPLRWNNAVHQFRVDPEALEQNRARYLARGWGTAVACLVAGKTVLTLVPDDLSAIAATVGAMAYGAAAVFALALLKVARLKAARDPHEAIKGLLK